MSRSEGDPPRSADVVIVGGGVIGCAVAYFLVTDARFDGSVTIVERDPSYRTASSALSASSLRLQFSTPENVAMSRYGLEFLRGARERFAADGIEVELAPEPCPYLVLSGHEGAPAARAAAVVQRAAGVAVAELDADALARRWPWLAASDVAVATLGPAEEGVFDGVGLHHALRRAAVARGARFAVGEVVGLDTRGGRVTAVRLAGGDAIACAVAVDAAGPHARAVARMAGAELPVSPRKRCIFTFRARNPPADAPIVVDTIGGVAFRPEGDQFIATLSRMPSGRDPETTSLQVEPDLFERWIWPALAARVPAFDELRVTGAWAGLYEVNTHDHNAILGWHPDVGGLALACGFSGHGLQHAPAAGRAVAELITHGAYRTLDLSALGYERLARGAAVEAGVI